MNTNQKKAWVATLISDKVDFRVIKIIKDKEGHYTEEKKGKKKEKEKNLNHFFD